MTTRRRALIVVALAAVAVFTTLTVHPPTTHAQDLVVILDPTSGPDGTTADVRVTGIADDEFLGIHFGDGRRIETGLHDGSHTTRHTFHGCRGDMIWVDIFAARGSGTRSVTTNFTATDPACDGESLSAGSNSVVYRGLGLPVEDALGYALPAVGLIWRFDNDPGRWLAWSRGLPNSLQGFTFLSPGTPYVVVADQAADWRFRTAAPRTDEQAARGALKVTFDPVAGPDLTDVTITVENAEPGVDVTLALPGGPIIGPADANGRFVHQDTMRGCSGDTISATAVSGDTGFERRDASVFTITESPCNGADLIAGVNSIAYLGQLLAVDEALAGLLDSCSCDAVLWQFDADQQAWSSWSSALRNLPPTFQGFQQLTPDTPYYVGLDAPGRWDWESRGRNLGDTFGGADDADQIQVNPSEGPSGTSASITVIVSGGSERVELTIGAGAGATSESGVSEEGATEFEASRYMTSFTFIGCAGPVGISATIYREAGGPQIIHLGADFTITSPPCPGYEEAEDEEPEPVATAVHIGAIDTGYAHFSGESQTNFCINLADENANPVAEATVTGRINGQTVSGVTDAEGGVTLLRTVFAFGAYTLEVTDVTHPDFTYDPASNATSTATVTMSGGQPAVFGCAA